MPCLRRRFPTHCARAPMHARRGLRAAAASCPIPRAAAAALHTRAAPRERVCLGRSWLRPRKPSPRKRSAARATHAPRFLLRLFRGTPRSPRAHLDPRRAGAASAGFGRGAFLLPPARGGAQAEAATMVQRMRVAVRQVQARVAASSAPARPRASTRRCPERSPPLWEPAKRVARRVVSASSAGCEVMDGHRCRDRWMDGVRRGRDGGRQGIGRGDRERGRHSVSMASVCAEA